MEIILMLHHENNLWQKKLYKTTRREKWRRKLNDLKKKKALLYSRTGSYDIFFIFPHGGGFPNGSIKVNGRKGFHLQLEVNFRSILIRIQPDDRNPEGKYVEKFFPFHFCNFNENLKQK